MFICSAHPTRCIYHAKMMLKRLRTSCLDYEAEHKIKGIAGGGLQGTEDESGFDYSMGLYNDNTNGEWHGRGYYFQILDGSPLSETLQYLEISHKGIMVYDSQNTRKRRLLKQLNLINVIQMCD